jgi:hypothetical protein
LIHAVADYFPEIADKCGEALGVPRERRFSTLSGYKRVIESGVDAVALEVPPYFLPEHAAQDPHSLRGAWTSRARAITGTS